MSETALRAELDDLHQYITHLENRLEASLKRSECLDAILSAIPDAVIFSDANRVIQHTNPAAQQIFGYEPEAFIGKPTSILYGFVDAHTEPPKNHQHTQANTTTYETAYRRKNGNIFISTTHETILRDQRGDYLGTVSIIQDVSEHNAIEDALRESQHFIERIADTSPQITYVYDLIDERNLYTSRNIASVLGYTPEQIKAMGTELLNNLLHPKDQAEIPAVHAKINQLADREILEREERLRHVDGTWYWFRVRESVFARNPDGTIRQTIGTMEDITAQKAAADEMSQKQIELEIILQTVPDAILFASPDRRIQYINTAVTRFFGYEPDELIGRTTRLLYNDPEDYERQGRLRYNPDAPVNLDSYEIVYRRKDGSTFISETHGMIIRNHLGEAIGLIALIRDVTARKEMEAALREQEAQLRQIIDMVPQQIYAKNREGRFLLVNRATAEIHNTTIEALTGSLITDFHPSRTEAEKFLQDDAIIFETGQPKFIPEEVLTDAHGKRYILQTTKIPLMMAGTREPAVLGVSTDITERKEAERALQEANTLLAASRDALKRLIEQLPIGIQVFDRDGWCIDVNQTHLDIFGIRNRQQILNIYNIFQDNLTAIQGTQAAAQQALAGATVNLGDLTFDFSAVDSRFAQIEGKRILNVTLFPVFDQEGHVVNFVGLNDDVTERRQAEQHRLDLAIQTERVKVLEELISDISHDLKTPLAIIGTSVYLLKKSTQDAAHHKYIHRIEVQQDRLEKLIDGLLTMSRLNRKHNIHASTVNIENLLKFIYEEKLPLAHERQINFEIKLNQNLLDIEAEAEELSRVFENLIDNAIYYTPPGGFVTVYATSTYDAVNIEVHDTGIGIEAADLPHIFERFYRADKARSSETGGTGLGLAIVQKIVSMHAGEITVASTPGKGSVFRVTLPRVNQTA